MKLKTKLTILFIVAILVITCTGCSNVNSEIIDFDTEELADVLLQELDFKDSLTKIQDHIIYNLYLLEEDDLECSTVYVGSGATAEEIAIFKASEEDKVSNIITAVNTRVSDQKDAFSSYLPAEVKKLEEYKLLVKGNNVILCLCDDEDKALQIINDFITQQTKG